MKRKWGLIILCAAPVVLAVSLAAFVKTAGTLAGYEFLRGAEAVLVERTQYPPIAGKRQVVIMRIYNIHRPHTDVIPSMEAELKTKGWTSMKPSEKSQRIWVRSGAPTSSSSMDLGYIAAVDGKGDKLPATAPRMPIDPKNTIEGWTMVVMMDEYKPNWAQSLIDRFSGPPKDILTVMNIRLTPGKSYRAENRP